MQIQVHNIPQILYVESKISDDVLKSLKEQSDYILKNENKFEKHNNNLVGNIQKEYKFYDDKKLLNETLLNLANKYYEISNENSRLNFKKYPNWQIESMWINFQKKYENNPVHSHTGDLSFVLWIQIPYNLKEELNLPNAKDSVIPTNSLFHFMFLNMFGEIRNVPLYIEKSWEGSIILFPSSLKHMVYPFYTSDDYRISIAGNLISY